MAKKNPNKNEADDMKKIIASLKGKLVTRMKHLLVPLGFVQTKNAFWNRFTKTMRQSFEFRQTSDKFEVRYGYLVLDRYGIEDIYGYNVNEIAYSHVIEKRWILPEQMTDVEMYVHEFMDYINVGILFFEKYMETPQLINDYNDGLVDKLYFAEGSGWQEYRIGISYYNSNNFHEAIRYFQEVIDKWSDKEFDFIQTRKKMSELWIQEIQKQMNNKIECNSAIVQIF